MRAGDRDCVPVRVGLAARIGADREGVTRVGLGARAGAVAARRGGLGSRGSAARAGLVDRSRVALVACSGSGGGTAVRGGDAARASRSRSRSPAIYARPTSTTRLFSAS